MDGSCRESFKLGFAHAWTQDVKHRNQVTWCRTGIEDELVVVEQDNCLCLDDCDPFRIGKDENPTEISTYEHVEERKGRNVYSCYLN